MKDTIYYNGDIVTVSEVNGVEAILIRDSKIHKVGTLAYIQSEAKEPIQKVDLEGKCILPSFIDTHGYLTAVASRRSYAYIGDVKNFCEMIERLESYKLEKGLCDTDWVIAYGYDHNNLEEKGHPSKEVIDTLINPVLIIHCSGYMGIMNSAGLKLAGIDETTVDPSGGRFGRVNGILNGYMEERAFIETTRHIVEIDMNQQFENIKEVQEIYASRGITTVQDGLMRKSDFALLKEASLCGIFKVDVTGYIDIATDPTLSKENRNYVGRYKNHLKIGGYKIILDGLQQGNPINENVDLCKMIKTCLKERIQLLTDCSSNSAAEQLLACFEKVVAEGHFKDTIRPVMIQGQFVRKDQIKKIKKLEMIPSYSIVSPYKADDTLLQSLEVNRNFKINSLKTILEQDVLFTLHQNNPFVLPNMLETIWCTVNGVSKEGLILDNTDKISVIDAIKAVTINAAYQYFEESKKGSIEEGKQADFVILDKNPLKVESMEIKDISVIETIKDGKVIYKKSK